MRKILFLLLGAVALGALTGCGSSLSSRVPVPTNPSGGNQAGFSNSSLSGTYVFTANGVNTHSNFAVVGSFVADGNGKITSGTRDTVTDSSGQALAESITGTYFVNVDGRGQLILNGGTGQAIYRFVLQSSTGGKLFQDGTGTSSIQVDAVGTIEQQSVTSAAPVGTYVFRLDGEDAQLSPYGAIGGITFSSDGSLTGLIDENDAGTFNQQLSAGGTVTCTVAYIVTPGQTPTPRCTATLTTPGDSIAANQATHNFIVYYVSPSRLEMVSTDSHFFLYGHADLQTSVASSVSCSTPGTASTFACDQVFNLSGQDNTGYPVAETGRFTLNGSGALANGIQDFNEAGTFFGGVNFSGTYSVSANGRWTANLSEPTVSVLTNVNLVGWQLSPQQSTVLVSAGTSSSIGNYAVLETGTMQAQNLGLVNSSVQGNYAQDFSGYGYSANVGNLESTGNYFADGNGNLNGTIDAQTDGSGLITDSANTGNYNLDPVLGRGTGTVSGVGVYIYSVDPNTLFLISSEPSAAYQGTMVKQQ